MNATPRHSLPFLFPAQAQKEHFHNEALAIVDAALHPVITDFRPDPPADAAIGQCWIVAAGGQAEWIGHDNQIACRTSGGWRFVPTVSGMLVWTVTAQNYLTFGADGWTAVLSVGGIAVDGDQVLGPRQPDVPSPSGGTTIDSEGRVAIDRIIATLKTHGLID